MIVVVIADSNLLTLFVLSLIKFTCYTLLLNVLKQSLLNCFNTSWKVPLGSCARFIAPEVSPLLYVIPVRSFKHGNGDCSVHGTLCDRLKALTLYPVYSSCILSVNAVNCACTPRYQCVIVFIEFGFCFSQYLLWKVGSKRKKCFLVEKQSCFRRICVYRLTKRIYMYRNICLLMEMYSGGLAYPLTLVLEYQLNQYFLSNRYHAVGIFPWHGLSREYDGWLHVSLGRGSPWDFWSTGRNACRYSTVSLKPFLHYNVYREEGRWIDCCCAMSTK